MRKYIVEQIYHTNIVGISQSGVKPIVRVEFENSTLRASADHLCLTDNGWMKLLDALESDAKFISTPSNSVMGRKNVR